MFKTIPRKSLPHGENIRQILDTLPPEILKTPSFLAGGFVVALLAAPRVENNPTQIKDGYYDDIDCYIADVNSIDKVKELFKLENNWHGPFQSTNALSYSWVDPESETTQTKLQIITRVKGTVEQVLSTFDIINAAAAYIPETDSFVVHQRFFAAYKTKEVEPLNLWALDLGNDEIITSNISRFIKYAQRWNHSWSGQIVARLQDLYLSSPRIKPSKNFTLVTPGFMAQAEPFVTYPAQQQIFSRRERNIWPKVSSYLVESEYFNEQHPSADALLRMAAGDTPLNAEPAF